MSWATTIYLPSDAGTIYTSGFVYNYYLSPTPGSAQVAIEFPNFNAASYSSIQLELTLEATPPSGSVDVYGYSHADGNVTSSDYNLGTYLGTIQIPQYNSEPWVLNVTSFVDGAAGSFFGFNIRGGPDLFGSLQYGQAPELVATPAPEPSSATLTWLAIGLFTAAAARFPRRRATS